MANRIVHHILPFLCIRFRAAQLPIPKLPLPNRNLPTMRPGSCDLISPILDPFLQRLWWKRVWRAEQMDVMPLSTADRAASVTFDGLVRLGAGQWRQQEVVRLVRVQSEKSELLLVSNKGREELSAELLALIYRSRWPVELFFKWLKCILGCRHWLAESQRGVALQVYCALIAALLLLRYSGRRPGKRAMEMIRFYLLGYASLDELSAALALEEKKA